MKVKATGIAVGSLTEGKEYTVLQKGDRDVVIENDHGKKVYATLIGQCPLLRPDCEWQVIKDSIDDATPEEWDTVAKTIREESRIDAVDAIAKKLREEEFPEGEEPDKEVSFDKEVDSPAHYNTGAVECIEAIGSALSGEEFQGYLRGNALKYLWRCMYKGKTKQDLEKCRWYIDRLLSTL